MFVLFDFLFEFDMANPDVVEITAVEAMFEGLEEGVALFGAAGVDEEGFFIDDEKSRKWVIDDALPCIIFGIRQQSKIFFVVIFGQITQAVGEPKDVWRDGADGDPFEPISKYSSFL